MRQRRIVALLFVVILGSALLTACGPSDSDFNKVEIGMTTQEVRSIMGEPNSKTQVLGAAEQWIYKDKYVIQFALNKVVIKEKR